MDGKIQCAAFTLKGSQCLKNAKEGRYCSIHKKLEGAFTPLVLIEAVKEAPPIKLAPVPHYEVNDIEKSSECSDFDDEEEEDKIKLNVDEEITNNLTFVETKQEIIIDDCPISPIMSGIVYIPVYDTCPIVELNTGIKPLANNSSNFIIEDDEFDGCEVNKNIVDIVGEFDIMPQVEEDNEKIFIGEYKPNEIVIISSIQEPAKELIMKFKDMVISRYSRPINKSIKQQIKSYQIPDMATCVTHAPKRANYINSFIMGKTFYLVSKDEVEAIKIDIDEINCGMISNYKVLPESSPQDKLIALVHKYNISYDDITPVMIAYDIETFNEDPTNLNIPLATDSTSFIGIISCNIVYPDKTTHNKAFVLNEVFHDKTKIIKDGKDIVICRSQIDLVFEFIIYVRELAIENSLAILHGFNASVMISKTKTEDENYVNFRDCGYDLPFILIKSGLSRHIKCSISITKSFGSCGDSKIKFGSHKIDIVNLFGPRVIICDTMDILKPMAAFHEKVGSIEHMDSHKLNDYAKVYLNDSKHDINYLHIGPILRDRKIITEGDKTYDINTLIDYCIQDSILCNKLLFSKDIDYLTNRIVLKNILQVSFSDVISGTEAKCLMHYLARIYRLAGVPFNYLSYYALQNHINNRLKILSPEEIKADLLSYGITKSFEELLKPCPNFKGGLNMNRTEPVEIFNDMITTDYKGLYPSVMMGFFISPFTFIEVSTTPPNVELILNGSIMALHNNPLDEDIFDKNILDGKECWLIFKRDINDPFLKTVKSFVTKKIETESLLKSCTKEDKPKLSLIRNTYKKCSNTLYGLNGSPGCYTYNYYIAAGVTLGARYALSTVRKIVKDLSFIERYADTDSVFFELPYKLPRDKDEHIKAYKIIMEILNDKLRLNLPYGQIHYEHYKIFELAREKTLTKFIAPIKRKVYVYKELLDDGKIKMGYSGYQFSQLSKIVKEKTLSLTSEILDTEPPKRFELVTKFLTSELEEMHKDITPYSRQVKYSNSMALSCANRFKLLNSNDKYMNILPIIGPPKSKRNDNYIPLEIYNTHKVELDYNQILCICYKSNIGRIIPEISLIINQIIPPNKTVKRVNIDELMDGYIKIKMQRGSVYTPDYHSMDLETITKFLPSTDVTFHEVLDEFIRLVFDLDIEKDSVIFNDFDIVTFISAVKYILNIQCEPIILEASNLNKKSFHIIYPLQVHYKFNEMIAKALKKKFICVDTQIYALNKSLRIPLCIKYKKDGFKDNRMFRVSNSVELTLKQLPQCFITYLFDDHNKPIQELETLFGLSPQICDGVCYEHMKNNTYQIGNMKFTELPVYQAILNYWKVVEYQIEVEPYKNGFKFRVIKGIKFICPLCDRSHESDSAYVIPSQNHFIVGCFRNENKRTITLKRPKDQIKRKYFSECMELCKPNTTEKKKYCDFNIDKVITFVRASLGSGKTFRLSELMENYHNILMIGFRRTNTRNMSVRLNFESYLDIKGRLEFTEHPKLIVQFDSLDRLIIENAEIEILVLDEVESILNQIYNAASHDRKTVASLIKLIRRANKIVVMDGLLSQRTIELITTIKKSSDIEIYENLYAPYSYNTKVYGVSSSLKAFTHIYDDIVSKLETGNKIYGSFGSVNLLNDLVAKLKLAGYNNIMYYTGQDLMIIEGRTMYKTKMEDFGRINEIIMDKKPQMFFYTTTLTAGVSVDINYFDTFVHACYSHVSPIDFLQSIARVRNCLKCKGSIYFINSGHIGYKTFQDALMELTNDLTIFEMSYQVLASINEREYQLAEFWYAYILDSLSSMGYILVHNKFIKTDTIKALKLDKIIQLTEKHIEIFKVVKTHEIETKLRDDIPKDIYEARPRYLLFKRFNFTLEEVNKLQGDLLLDALNLVEGKISKYFINFIKLTYKEKIDFITQSKELKPLTTIKDIQIIGDTAQSKINTHLKDIATTQRSGFLINDCLNIKGKRNESSLSKFIVSVWHNLEKITNTSETKSITLTNEQYRNIAIETLKGNDEIIDMFLSDKIITRKQLRSSAYLKNIFKSVGLSVEKSDTKSHQEKPKIIISQK